MIEYTPILIEQVAPEKIPSWKKSLILYNAGINALKKEKRELAYWLFKATLLQPNLSPEVLYLAHLYAGEMEEANKEYCNYRMLMGATDCKGLMLVKLPSHAVHDTNPLVKDLDAVIKEFGNGEGNLEDLNTVIDKIKAIPEVYSKQCVSLNFREAQPKFDQTIERGLKAVSSVQQKLPLPYTMILLYLMKESLLQAVTIPKGDLYSDPSFPETLETLDLMEALDYKPKPLPNSGGEGW